MSRGAFKRNEPLAYHTSLQVGGPAAYWHETSDSGNLPAVLALAAEAQRPVFMIGNGTNVLFSDAGFPGLVVKLSDISFPTHLRPWGRPHPNMMEAQAYASYSWDRFVEGAIVAGGQGIECLSGIPGTVGGAVVQNIGAYGQQLSDTLAWVDVVDRADLQFKRLMAEQCGFGYRTSIFNSTDAGRYIIRDVILRLRCDQPGCRTYDQVAAAVPEGATPSAVRDAVLTIRYRKGMLAGQHQSAGSFFKNPIVPIVDYPEEASALFLADGRVKLSAAWLIERAGFSKGYARGRTAISPDHALALVSHPWATSSDIVALAREIQEKVAERFGLVLEPEVQLVGFDEYPLLR